MIGTLIFLSFVATHAPAAAAQPAMMTSHYSATAVTEDLQSYAGELQRCYDQYRPAVRPHIGRIRLHFALAADGAVEATTIAHDGLHSRAATACIRQAAAAWHFPAPPEAHAQLEYTFLFR